MPLSGLVMMNLHTADSNLLYRWMESPSLSVVWMGLVCSEPVLVVSSLWAELVWAEPVFLRKKLVSCPIVMIFDQISSQCHFSSIVSVVEPVGEQWMIHELCVMMMAYKYDVK